MEIGTEAAQFLFWKYIVRIFFAVRWGTMHLCIICYGYCLHWRASIHPADSSYNTAKTTLHLSPRSSILYVTLPSMAPTFLTWKIKTRILPCVRRITNPVVFFSASEKTTKRWFLITSWWDWHLPHPLHTSRSPLPIEKLRKNCGWKKAGNFVARIKLRSCNENTFFSLLRKN